MVPLEGFEPSDSWFRRPAPIPLAEVNIFMNPYCCHLDLPRPLVDGFDFRSINVYHSQTDVRNLNSDLVKILDLLNLKVTFVPIFRTLPGQITPIHSDSSTPNLDFVKLNFVFNELDSAMVWYKPKSVKYTTKLTAIKTAYIQYEPNEVEEIHRQNLNGCSLAQVGIPHNVVVNTEIRYAVSLTLKSKETNKTISMQDAKEIFKDYLGTPDRIRTYNI